MVRRVKCKRCGACARTTRGISITAAEMEKIQGKVPLIEQKGSLFAGKIPVDKQGFCVALEKRGNRAGCKIYPVRPGRCRQYPLMYFGGRAIIQRDCTAVKGFLSEGKRFLKREEIEKIPFLAESLKALEYAFPEVKAQEIFGITNA